MNMRRIVTAVAKFWRAGDTDRAPRFRPRSKDRLVAALMEAAAYECEGRGGWQYRIREQQKLMREAAFHLAGRRDVAAFRKALEADLFRQ